MDTKLTDVLSAAEVAKAAMAEASEAMLYYIDKRVNFIKGLANTEESPRPFGVLNKLESTDAFISDRIGEVAAAYLSASTALRRL